MADRGESEDRRPPPEVPEVPGGTGSGRDDEVPFRFRLLRNWFGLIGVVLVLGGLVTFAFLFLVEVMTGHPNPYVGIIHYLVLPPLILLGVVLVGAGIWIQRRRVLRGVEPGSDFGGFDLRRRRVQQRVLVLGGVLSGTFIFVLSVGGYEAYHFTETVTFCGQACHSVMKPEFTAYQHSPHARVSCTECHVGPGAGWYVRSKLSGAYQVYATARNIYPRPIPTPIESLRPAQETCEECHWPRYFFGARQTFFKHYTSDGGEEPWQIEMLINIGGGDPERGYTRGIHWHMNIANKVEYIARDEQLQDIPWIRLTDPQGNVTVYADTEEPPSEELLQEGEVHRMDCIDCHNRPSHIYDAPVEALNRELELGNIDPSLPDIKYLAIEQLVEEYESVEEAERGITDGLRTAYAEDYPDFYADNRELVDRAVVTLRRVYGENFFPEMNVRWDVYPDNIGHWIWPGCFRCHDGLHESPDGRVISADCNSCHTIMSQGVGGANDQFTGNRQPFIHPLDGEVMDEPILCHECHDGALGLS